MKYKVLKDIRNIYKKGEVLDLTQGELDYGLRISVDNVCPIEELISDGYMEEGEKLVEKEKKEPKFIVGEKIKVGNFYTTIKSTWEVADGIFSYYIEAYNPDYSVQLEENLKKPTDYELKTYF